jgi:hypothetical protein
MATICHALAQLDSHRAEEEIAERAALEATRQQGASSPRWRRKRRPAGRLPSLPCKWRQCGSERIQRRSSTVRAAEIEATWKRW